MKAILIAEDGEEWAYLQWRKDSAPLVLYSGVELTIPADNVIIQRESEHGSTV